jgi:hypothetical protein
MSRARASVFAGLTAATVALAAFAVTAQTTPSSSSSSIAIDAVSNRADLVSGGDVLLRVTLPAGQAAGAATLAVGGVAVPGALKPAPDGKGQLALVTGLPNGTSVVSVTAGGRKAKLEVTNHPNGGPVFSGPQIQPWTCRAGATDAQCNRPVEISWSYMPRDGKEFKPYDPASPATDVATTTTSGGVTVPFIVRVESFAQNRSGVSFAALYDPAQPWTPFAPQRQWNKGLYVLQGAGCGTGYFDVAAGSPLNVNALGKGYVVATAALLNNNVNCNPVVQAEAAVMAKEHVVETYGVFDMVFAQGSSGGAISQITDQNAYPGLYDGLILNHLFADSDASRMASYDCRVVYDAWAKPGALPWTDEQKTAVVGMISGCNSHTQTTRYEVYNPRTGTSCNIPEEKKYDPVKNPKGVRCTLQDYEVNQVGRREDGAAFTRMDNEGVQYGLKALLAGTISPAQFVELNASVGGHDGNFERTEARAVADRRGLKSLYVTGLNNTESNLSETPILETRVLATDFHQVAHAYISRARIVRSQGNHDNYVLWRSMTNSDPSFSSAFDVMVQWIKAIKADTRTIPQARKVVENKPAAAVDRCTLGDGKDQPMGACTKPLELTRVLAGAPETNDVGKCELKPLNRSDYPNVKFTDEQWASLSKTFKTGVCDYSKPLVDYAPTTPWLTYSGDGKYRPLGAAPRSTAE